MTSEIYGESVGPWQYKSETKQKKAHAPPFFRYCRWCGLSNKPPGTRSITIDTIDSRGLFCSLRCAARYGVAIVEKESYVYQASSPPEPVPVRQPMSEEEINKLRYSSLLATVRTVERFHGIK